MSLKSLALAAMTAMALTAFSQSQPKKFPIRTLVGKTAADVERVFGKPMVEPFWVLSEARAELGGGKVKTASVSYKVKGRPQPGILAVVYIGRPGKAAIVASIFWQAQTNNGWSEAKALEDVADSLASYTPLKGHGGFDEADKVFASKKNKKLRLIIKGSFGSRHVMYVLNFTKEDL